MMRGIDRTESPGGGRRAAQRFGSRPASAVCTGRGPRPLGQGGQALVECLVAMLVLAVLWVSVSWLGRYQDIAMSATHAGRHAAFLASRLGLEEARESAEGRALVLRYFTGDAHRWKDRRGTAILDASRAVHVAWQRSAPLADSGQPGGASPQLAELRRDWRVHDDGRVQASVRVQFDESKPPAETGARALGLNVRDAQYPVLQRRAYILAGSGHAASDATVQTTVMRSGRAWGSAYGASRSIGGLAVLQAAPVDRAWDRPEPDFDWLQPWGGRVPGHLVQTHEGHHNEYTFPHP